eukprot:402446-Rhodomonas_salina.1
MPSGSSTRQLPMLTGIGAGGATARRAAATFRERTQTSAPLHRQRDSALGEEEEGQCVCASEADLDVGSSATLGLQEAHGVFGDLHDGPAGVSERAAGISESCGCGLVETDCGGRRSGVRKGRAHLFSSLRARALKSRQMYSYESTAPGESRVSSEMHAQLTPSSTTVSANASQKPPTAKITFGRSGTTCRVSTSSDLSWASLDNLAAPKPEHLMQAETGDGMALPPLSNPMPFPPCPRSRTHERARSLCNTSFMSSMEMKSADPKPSSAISFSSSQLVPDPQKKSTSGGRSSSSIFVAIAFRVNSGSCVTSISVPDEDNAVIILWRSECKLMVGNGIGGSGGVREWRKG